MMYFLLFEYWFIAKVRLFIHGMTSTNNELDKHFIEVSKTDITNWKKTRFPTLIFNMSNNVQFYFLCSSGQNDKLDDIQSSYITYIINHSSSILVIQ